MSPAKGHHRLSAGFVVIIFFKCLKGALFILIGIAALRLVKMHDIPTAAQLARFLGVSADSHIIQRVAGALSRTTPQRAAEVAAAALFVAAVFFAEATLLIFRIWWSTYLMIGLTALGLPLEVFEIVQRPRYVGRYIALLINVAIVIYLWRRRNEFRTPRRRVSSRVRV